jgi:1-acyl-sn-glycerol-3-phosphate acyltransferase
MYRWIKASILSGPKLICDLTKISHYAKHKNKYSKNKRYKIVKNLVSFVSKKLNVDLFVEGIENIDKTTSQFLVSNHLSSFDPLGCLCVIDENTSFVSKIELKGAFVLGSIINCLDGLFLDRENLKQSLKVMMKVQKELSDNEGNWIIYPEGTRNKDELAVIKDFHSGTFRSAVKANVSIVPIAIYGSQRVLKVNKFKRVPVFISILKPISPNEYKDLTTEEIAKLCKDNIQRELTFNLRKKDHEYMLKHNKKHYKFNQIN